MTTRRFLLLPLAALALAACVDDQLPDAFYENEVETFTIGALHGTPVTVPSAYSVVDNRTVRTDQSIGFDFAFVRDDGRHLLAPLDAIGLGARSTNPGLQQSSLSFDQLITPPGDGYITDEAVEVEVGDVLVVRSRIACYLGVPQYAKLLIKSIDATAGTITFDAVANINCGYRSLALGIPRT